jgi:Tfp pilus assembly PilM family ATPase
MREYRVLPLGIDLGESRVRIAVFERHRFGTVRLRAVVSKDVSSAELIPLLLEEMLRETGVRERRCVIALGSPSTALRVMRLPKMSWAERMRAARFEAQRFVPWDIEAEPTHVRTHAIDAAQDLYAVGAVRAQRVHELVALLRTAGLAVHAIDHDALAFRRALPDADAIIDVGTERSSVHAFPEDGPFSLHVPIGGATMTRGIACDLAIEFSAAEHRKRIIGCGGAGIRAHEELVSQLATAVDRARERVTVARIVLCGNGAKLADLAQSLAMATSSSVELRVPDALRGEAYPEDVLRAAAPDWTLAAGLGTWSAAA